MNPTLWSLGFSSAFCWAFVPIVQISIAYSALPYVDLLASPWQAILALFRAPQTREILSQGSVLLIGLIAATLLFVRPLQKEIESIRGALKRYVLPRHLSKDQQQQIADILAAHPPQEVILVQPPHYEEASSYRCDFQAALTKGGWKIKTVEISENAGEGLRIRSRRPMGTDDKPAEILRDALYAAGVTINGTGSGSGQKDVEYVLYLEIGKRRMDDNDRTVKEDIKHQIEHLQKELKKRS